jgi:hypothetical protein
MNIFFEEIAVNSRFKGRPLGPYAQIQHSEPHLRDGKAILEVFKAAR